MFKPDYLTACLHNAEKRCFLAAAKGRDSEAFDVVSIDMSISDVDFAGQSWLNRRL